MKLIALLILLMSISIVGAAQQRPPLNLRDDSDRRTQADDNFDLNISERRIAEQNFAASTSVAVETADRNNVRVQVGVSLTAQKIDVLLRNVTGKVRFRASLQRILDLVEVHAASSRQ